MSDTTKPWELHGETPESRAWAIVQNVFNEHYGQPDPRDVACYITEAIEAALADNAPKWISVTERLPEPGIEVIYYHYTHWQPLPAPPQEEE